MVYYIIRYYCPLAGLKQYEIFHKNNSTIHPRQTRGLRANDGVKADRNPNKFQSPFTVLFSQSNKSLKRQNETKKNCNTTGAS